MSREAGWWPLPPAPDSPPPPSGRGRVGGAFVVGGSAVSVGPNLGFVGSILRFIGSNLRRGVVWVGGFLGGLGVVTEE